MHPEIDAVIICPFRAGFPGRVAGDEWGGYRLHVQVRASKAGCGVAGTAQAKDPEGSMVEWRGAISTWPAVGRKRPLMVACLTCQSLTAAQKSKGRVSY
ncbi:hypothetical protein ACOMHN_017971 [Nucella lapillus]